MTNTTHDFDQYIRILETPEKFNKDDLEITELISLLVRHPNHLKVAIHYTQKYIYRVNIESYFRNLLFNVYLSLEKVYDEDLLCKFYLLVKELHETGVMNAEELENENIRIKPNGDVEDPQLELLRYKYLIKNF